MEINAILCNHAEAVNNMLYVAGGGIGIAYAPPGSPPPYAVTLGIGLIVTVPWGQTNQQHKVQIVLLTEDGDLVQLVAGPEQTGTLEFELAFNVGRGPNLAVGDDQNVCLAANLVGLPMPAFAKYEFVIRVDGHDERKLPLRVEPAPGAGVVFSAGTPGGAPG